MARYMQDDIQTGPGKGIVPATSPRLGACIWATHIIASADIASAGCMALAFDPDIVYGGEGGSAWPPSAQGTEGA